MRILSGIPITALLKQEMSPLIKLKNKVKVMIGGVSVTRAYASEIGAEGFAEDCTSAVDEAARLMEL